MRHSKYGDLAVGDMLQVEIDGRSLPVVVAEYIPGTWKARVHPYVGPDSGWFDAADVQRWRDEHWGWLKAKGVTPRMVAEAMFPENWR